MAAVVDELGRGERGIADDLTFTRSPSPRSPLAIAVNFRKGYRFARHLGPFPNLGRIVQKGDS